MALRAKERVSANYAGLTPANERASIAARGASKKSGTKPEVLLRKALWKLGFRYSLKPSKLPGRPDIVLPAHFGHRDHPIRVIAIGRYGSSRSERSDGFLESARQSCSSGWWRQAG